jgi:hypothetical protein
MKESRIAINQLSRSPCYCPATQRPDEHQPRRKSGATPIFLGNYVRVGTRPINPFFNETLFVPEKFRKTTVWRLDCWQLRLQLFSLSRLLLHLSRFLKKAALWSGGNRSSRLHWTGDSEECLQAETRKRLVCWRYRCGKEKKQKTSLPLTFC